MEIDIRTITTNEQLFQNRCSLNMDHVNRIAANIDIKVLQANPVTLYKYNGQNIVLSGHHRYAAAKQAKLTHLPCTFFHGTLSEAQKFALDSNAGNLQETFFERAKKYRLLLKSLSINEVLNEIKKVHTKDAIQILEFSLLPENSIPIQELKMFQNAGISTDNNIILDCCQWTGAIVRTNRKIDTEQINEIYRFAKESYIKLKEGKRLFNKNTFVEYVTGLLDRAKHNSFVSFKEAGESEVKKNFDNAIKELQEQIRQAEKNLNEKRVSVMFASITPDEISKVLQSYEITVITLKKQLAELNGQKDKILNAEKQQTDIFSMIEVPETHITANGGQVCEQTDVEVLELTEQPEINVNKLFNYNKTIINQNQKNMENSNKISVQVIDYSERAIIVIGQTKEIKTQLAEIGGRFNRYLKHEGNTVAGWVFSKKASDKVNNLINNL